MHQYLPTKRSSRIDEVIRLLNVLQYVVVRMILNLEKLINVLIGKPAFQIGSSADDVGDSFPLECRFVVSSLGVSDA